MARKKWCTDVNTRCGRPICVNKGEFDDLWCKYHARYVIDCFVCGRMFHSKRPHTKYCSNACSQKAYRERKEVS